VVPLIAGCITETELGNIKSYPVFKQFVCVSSLPSFIPPKEITLMHILATIHHFKYLYRVPPQQSFPSSSASRVVSVISFNLSLFHISLHLLINLVALLCTSTSFIKHGHSALIQYMYRWSHDLTVCGFYIIILFYYFSNSILLRQLTTHVPSRMATLG